ncbi:type III-B CRISPR-associated protein Cas10/Cmr2 [Bacillus methanolicus]|uniref:type III-B CRISPR-associated protein Cas10/Cmr2 n=1 Tax=Bacillus methanolicus TaxID=1471 RepID=UPI0023807E04|nr:type III-B CRISPR-associated protein Cas10/Cmr2 [Bacillus methanolicus]MDE3840932.1 type III-B CRISPR-associated protein Cas10/Cmr2 [Bacillus methanolicus]
MSNQHLVVFTVGPVQSFIASARKTEDFWSGSFILSHFIREAMKMLSELDPKCEFIYPKNIQETDVKTRHIASLPNRFTAIVHKDAQSAAAILQETEGHVRRVFYDLCTSAIHTVFPSLDKQEKEILKEKAVKQVDAFLEVYWVVEPYDSNIHFQEIRERAEKRLGALKNDKQYPGFAQYGLTCSVCKEREALCLEDLRLEDKYGDMKRKLAETWNRRSEIYKVSNSNEEQEQQAGRIKDNEFLCGICLGKRTAWDYFTNKLENKHVFRRFQSVLDIGKGNYYAILMMDGDNMGQWFSGENKKDFSSVSERLAHFSQQVVPKIVEQDYNGRLVYAGGDDVLAFVPVDEALHVAQALRFAFSQPEQGLGEKATASIGLVIGHKKTPLQSLLNIVRQLEKKAKGYENPQSKVKKNALALAVHTRSGEISEAIMPWEIGSSRTVELLLDFISLLQNDLSSTFIYHFSNAFFPLLYENEEFRKLKNHEMVQVELRRLLKRSVKEGRKVESLEQHVEALLMLHTVSRSGYDFLNLLKMLTFFKRSEGEMSEKADVKTG